MANHSLPTTTDLYANVLTYLHARIDDIAKWNSSANTTGTNLPVGSVRWNDTSFQWERNTGTVATPTWTALSSTYTININGTVGATTPAAGSFTTLSSSGVASLGANSTIGGVAIVSVGASQTFTGVNTFTNAASPIVVAKIGPSTTQQHTLSAVASDTIALLSASQTFTNKTYNAGALSGTFTGNVILSGQVSFSEATAPIISAKIGPSTTQQHSIPTTTSDTIALLTATQTFTNKTFSSGTLSGTFTGNTTLSGQISFTEATAPIISAKIGPSTIQQHSIPAVTSDTIVLLAATQTLTNKTLTSPTSTNATINTPSITNGTISGTSISGAAITTSSFSGSTGAFTGAISSTFAGIGYSQSASSTATVGISIANTNTTGFAGIQLTSNSLNKYIRVSSTGVLETVNSANNTVISSLTDAGLLTAVSFTGAGTGLTGTASALSIGGTAATATLALTASALTTTNSYTGITFTASGGGTNIGMQFGGQATTGIYHDNANMAIRTGSATATMYFQRSGGTFNMATLDANGNFTAGANVTATSDERLKKNWKCLPKDFIAHISKIKYGIYDRTDIVATQVGVSAQDILNFLPEVISRDSKGMLSVAYGNLALVTCIELAKELEAVKLELARLIGE